MVIFYTRKINKFEEWLSTPQPQFNTKRIFIGLAPEALHSFVVIPKAVAEIKLG
jgi:hypothetical protein